MTRQRKPTAQLEREGAFVKHPERKAERANEPKTSGPLGAPPRCFTAAGGCSGYSSERLIAIWDEIVSEAPPGVLTFSDRKHVELAARLLLRVRTGAAKSGDYSRLDVLFGKMGMNPADRSKVEITPTGATAPDASNAKHVDSPFSDIAAETGRPN